jgi:hypothetical protein
MVPDDRDRAHGRLRSLTAWISGISAALVGVFAGIAAVTIPGTSDASAAAPASASTGAGESEEPESAPTPEPVQVQPPASVPVAAPPGPPHARSGGSSHR